jgi:hypothetical protein
VEATCSFELVLPTDQTTLCHIPERCNLSITPFVFQTTMPVLFKMRINAIQYICMEVSNIKFAIQYLYLITKLHKSWCPDIPPPFGIYTFLANNNTDILSHQIYIYAVDLRYTGLCYNISCFSFPGHFPMLFHSNYLGYTGLS